MSYQSEAELEKQLINKLSSQGYSYIKLEDYKALENNFRVQLNYINKSILEGVDLSDKEFERILIYLNGKTVYQSAKQLRDQFILDRDNGRQVYINFLNENPENNVYQVTNQVTVQGKYVNRYDVTILINGLPLVQIELKRRGVDINQAINQIDRYRQHSFKELFKYIQIFVVSNGVETRYFANTNEPRIMKSLTFYWTREDNERINILENFSSEFLEKNRLLKMITKYMVINDTDKCLIVMRPYQVYATEALIRQALNTNSNGYIWHTTGSGKTLTSFKAATLLKDNPDIEKCLFVVDRKDLDRQTRQEFNRFQENCVEENTDTATLVRRMLSTDYANKVIVTTIQKLGIALDPNNRKNYKEQLMPLQDSRIVFIFDECHRSQFGDNHKAIKEFFPNAQLFGFTGTPIFDTNATYTKINGETASYKTTEDIFEKQLHAYTITNAIDDRNVLRFHVDYFKPSEDNPRRADGSIKKQAIVETILAKHDTATHERRFNAILATSSINDAIEYYHLFKQMQGQYKSEDPSFEPLNVACVFSPPAEGNPDIRQIQEDLQQEKIDNEQEPERKKQALKEIIDDYDRQYGTNHVIDDFDAYYQDIQQRIKDQQYSNKDYPHANKIDITIVVDMLLTGFDSKFLNTLYVDKRLIYHHLIQAFSRTNRILNDTKPYGNILDFRGQQDAVDNAIALFSGKKDDKEAAKRIWLVEPASSIQKKYKEAVAGLRNFMQSYNLEFNASEVANLQGDEAKVGFINHFKEVQRYKTQLDQYVDCTDEAATAVVSDPPSDYGFTDDDLLAFRGAYLNLAYSLKKKREKSAEPVPPEVEDLDFEFVLFASAMIDYDYIMDLIAKQYGGSEVKVRLTREQLVNIVLSNSNLMDEREDIIAYINSLEAVSGKTEQEIKEGYNLFKAERYAKEVASIAQKYEITAESLNEFIDGIMERKIFDAEKLNDLLAPLNLGWKARSKKELALMADLIPLLKRKAEGEEIAGLSAYEE